MKTERPQAVFKRRLTQLLPKGRAKLVAKRSGISETTLSNWRRGYGKCNPELETLEKLAEAISSVSGVSVTAGSLISDDVGLPARTLDQIASRIQIAIAREVQAAVAEARGGSKPQRES